MTSDTNIDVIIDEEDDGKALPVAKADVDDLDQPILPKGAERNDNGSVTLTLLHPRTLTIKNGQGVVREVSYDTLTFHRLNGADFNRVRTTAEEHQQLKMFVCSTRMREVEMRALYDRLDAADITRAGRVLNTFF